MHIVSFNEHRRKIDVVYFALLGYGGDVESVAQVDLIQLAQGIYDPNMRQMKIELGAQEENARFVTGLHDLYVAAVEASRVFLLILTIDISTSLGSVFFPDIASRIHLAPLKERKGRLRRPRTTTATEPMARKRRGCTTLCVAVSSATRQHRFVPSLRPCSLFLSHACRSCD